MPELLTDYKKYLVARGYARKTVKLYSLYFEEFYNFYSGQIETLTTEEIDLFFLNCSGSTAKKIIAGAAVRFYYEQIKRQGRLDLILPKRKQQLPEILTEDEIKKILELTSNLKHKAILMLIYSAGLRISEARALRISDIDSKNMVINVRDRKGSGVELKTGGRIAPLSSLLLNTLREYFKAFRPSVYLFNAINGGKISTFGISQALSLALFRAGIDKKITVHGLRHSFATHLYNRDKDIYQVQNVLGHKSTNSTAIYIRLAQNKVISPLDTI